MIGSKLGPYELIEEIGHGGMATVYRAYQPSMDRYVAIKVIRNAIRQDYQIAGSLHPRSQAGCQAGTSAHSARSRLRCPE